VVPKDFNDWQKLIGTGAYTLESFEPGVRLCSRTAVTTGKPTAATSTPSKSATSRRGRPHGRPLQSGKSTRQTAWMPAPSTS
jgi:hypothetical protein